MRSALSIDSCFFASATAAAAAVAAADADAAEAAEALQPASAGCVFCFLPSPDAAPCRELPPRETTRPALLALLRFSAFLAFSDGCFVALLSLPPGAATAASAAVAWPALSCVTGARRAFRYTDASISSTSRQLASSMPPPRELPWFSKGLASVARARRFPDRPLQALPATNATPRARSSEGPSAPSPRWGSTARNSGDTSGASSDSRRLDDLGFDITTPLAESLTFKHLNSLTVPTVCRC